MVGNSQMSNAVLNNISKAEHGLFGMEIEPTGVGEFQQREVAREASYACSRSSCKCFQVVFN